MAKLVSKIQALFPCHTDDTKNRTRRSSSLVTPKLPTEEVQQRRKASLFNIPAALLGAWSPTTPSPVAERSNTGITITHPSSNRGEPHLQRGESNLTIPKLRIASKTPEESPNRLYHLSHSCPNESSSWRLSATLTSRSIASSISSPPSSPRTYTDQSLTARSGASTSRKSRFFTTAEIPITLVTEESISPRPRCSEPYSPRSEEKIKPEGPLVPLILGLTVVQATNLPNTELGFKDCSNPYVTVEIKSKTAAGVEEKQIQSTPVKHGDLNPKWNHNFKFPLMVAENCTRSFSLRITVLDHDDILDHPTLGSASEDITDAVHHALRHPNSSNVYHVRKTLMLPISPLSKQSKAPPLDWMAGKNLTDAGELHFSFKVLEE